MAVLPDECADEMLETVPVIMRAIRAEMRRRRTADLTVPQFRTLLYLTHHPGAPLLAVAEFLGLTPPSASKMVDGLVLRGLVERSVAPADRRRVALEVTAQGQLLLEQARRGTRARLSDVLGGLSPEECVVIARAMQTLRPLFTPPASNHALHERK